MREQHGQEGSIAADAAERVRSIVSAAESEAARIRYEAEHDAQQRLREAETQSLRFLDDAKRRADSLVDERVRRIRDLSEQVVERSQNLFERIDNASELRQQLDDLVQALGEAAQRVAGEADVFDGARLVALQMAVAGSTREEVEVHLHRAFGREPHGILDDVFGSRFGRPGSPEIGRRPGSGEAGRRAVG